MSEVPDEIRDLQSNVALSMLADLFKYNAMQIQTRKNQLRAMRFIQEKISKTA